MAAAPDLSQAKRIYVRAPNWVGDFVMATASLVRIRKAFPGAHISLAARPFLLPLCKGSDWFDDFLPTPEKKGLSGILAESRRLRSGRYDLAVVLPNSLSTGLVAFLGRVPVRLGYLQGRSWLMTHGLRAITARHFWQKRRGPRRVPVPMPNYYRDLLDVLGLPGDSLHPDLPLTDEAKAWVDAHLRSLGIAPHEKIVLFVVGANFGASKLWMPERFAETARRFAAKGYRPIVTVGPAEVELGRRIGEDAGAIALVDPVLSLDKLSALVARCALMVTGDTGPRHLAVAFDRPVVCLMGPTDSRYTDYCLERTVLIQKKLPCTPCQMKVCPLGHHQCMRDIGVDEVVAAGEGLLAKFG
jgi:heptosyltransferase II